MSGDIEVWAEVCGHPQLEANTGGVIRRAKDGSIKIARLHKGYLHIQFKTDGIKRKVPVHGLVLLAFHGPKPFPEAVCRHLDGNPLNNTTGNLAWGTRSENNLDAVRHGTAVSIRLGERHPKTRLLDSHIVAIRSLVQSGVSCEVVAKAFGIHPTYAARIHSGKSRAMATAG